MTRRQQAERAPANRGRHAAIPVAIPVALIFGVSALLTGGCEKTKKKHEARLAEAQKKALDKHEKENPPPPPPEPPKPFEVLAEWGTAATGEKVPPYNADASLSTDEELRNRLIALAYKPPNKHTTKMLKGKGDPAIDALLKACWHGNERVRAQSVRLLTRLEFDHAKAVEPIGRLLRTDRAAATRAAAAGALVDLKIAALGDALAEVLVEDKDDSTRANAAWALGKIGHAPAVPNLTKALKDPATWVRIRACTALGRLKAKAARKPLEHVLSDPNGEVRKSAARALRKITGRRYKQRTPRLSL